MINKASNKNEVFDIIYRIFRLYLPNILYKYYSLTNDNALNNKKIDSLKNNKIYMSNAKDLNDPFESKAYFYRPQKLKKYKRLAQIDGKIIDDFSVFAKISSFTTNGINSMPMWAHYSNNHEGFCASYDTKDNRNVQFSSCTFPVQYLDKRIDVTYLMENQVKNMICEINKQKGKGIKKIVIDDLSLVFMIAFFCNIKHKTWSYENEFRCTVGASDSGSHYFSAYPKEIFIGMNCVPEYKKKLIETAEELQIPVYKMCFEEENMDFKLSAIEL